MTSEELAQKLKKLAFQSILDPGQFTKRQQKDGDYERLDQWQDRAIDIAFSDVVAEVERLKSNESSLLELLQDARNYITPTISTHEEISEVLGWCDCGYCTHVPKEKPAQLVTDIEREKE